MNSKTCPSIEELEAYFHKRIEESAQKEMEEHFFECGQCAEISRTISISQERMQLSKARPMLGRAFERYGDFVDAKAAGDAKPTKIHEVMTKNKEFRLVLRPIERRPEQALLEIEVLKPSIGGYLKIMGSEGFQEWVQLDDQRTSCVVVNRSLELERIVIQKCQQKG
jgi:hypothetical protein